MGKMIHGSMNIKEGEIFLRWVNNRIAANKNVITATTGPTGCLSEGTIVEGQTKTLGELYSSGKILIDTVSINKQPNKDGCYYPKKSKSEIINSGIKEVYEIELEDGEMVLATKDHRFFKKQGNKIEEVRVEDLNVGDDLRCYPNDYVDNYFHKAKLKEQKKRDIIYNPKKLCKKCGTLFYQESKERGKQRLLCKSCLKTKPKVSEKKWKEWEDNLLRQFYYSFPKERLMKLLPLRKSWRGIQHRANRLNLRRNPELQWKQNAWTSKNNPVHNPKSFAKMMKKQAPIFKRNEMTSIEKKVARFLDKNNIDYEFNKVVKTKTSFRFPDFRIGKLIIECDGVYWHKNMKKEDKARENELKELGFEVIRFTDKEIKNEWEHVKECIQKKLNQ